MDRPLTKLEHFKRYINYVIKLETVNPVEKRKRFKGIIENVTSDNQVIMSMDDISYNIEYDNIAKAKIVITDELWEQFLKAQKNKS